MATLAFGKTPLPPAVSPPGSGSAPATPPVAVRTNAAFAPAPSGAAAAPVTPAAPRANPFAPQPAAAEPAAAPAKPTAPRKRKATPAPATPATPADTQGAIDVQAKAEVVNEVAEQAGAAADEQTKSALPHEKRAAAREAAKSAAPAEPTSTAVGKYEGAGFGGDSDISANDIVLPKLHLTQKVGDLSEVFAPGTIVLNRQTPLPQPLTFVLLGFKPKYWVERAEGGGGQIARSEQEVVSLGGTTSYDEADAKGIPLFQTVVTGVLMLKYQEIKDESSGEVLTQPGDFPYIYEPDGSAWCICTWAMKGTCYTNAAKPLMTARLIGRLRAHPAGCSWDLTTKMVKFKTGNWAAQPSLKQLENTTPEFQAWAFKCVFGSTTVDE